MENPKPTPVEVKRDLNWWMSRIANSNGESVLLPEEFIAIVKEVQAVDKEVTALMNQIAEMQIKNEQKMQNVWLSFREHVAKNGQPDVWLKDVGLDTNALADGFFVVNVREKK